MARKWPSKIERRIGADEVIHSRLRRWQRSARLAVYE
jgi:hypothetical protein